MRANEACLPVIQSLLQKGSQPPSLAFGRDPKASRKVEKLYVNKRLQVCSDWRLLAPRTWRQDVRSGASYMTDLGNIFGFLQLVLIWKWGQDFKEAVSH